MIARGVAVDSAGNVYVADTANEEIREINSAGVVSTLAGSAGAHRFRQRHRQCGDNLTIPWMWR